MSIDVTSLMQQIAEVIDRFNQPAVNRVKIKFCGLCKAICDRPDVLTLRKDDAARNLILDLVMKWLSPSSVHTAMGNGLMSDYLDSSVAELNMACLRTVVRLLDRLQLRLPDVAGAKPETTDTESALVMSGVFKRYSDQLLRCLDDCLETSVGPFHAYHFHCLYLHSQMSDSTSELGSIHKVWHLHVILCVAHSSTCL
jgi:neurofibromin 1